AAGRVQDRLGAVGLGQGGSRIGRVLGISLPGQRPGALALQDVNRAVQVVAHLLKALTGDGSLHWSSPPVRGSGPARARVSPRARTADSEQLAGLSLLISGKRHD